MKKYVHLKRTLADKGKIVPYEDILDWKVLKSKYLQGAPDSDWYSSLYYYPEDIIHYYDKNNGSVAGYAGPAFSDHLLFDIDFKDSIEIARTATQQLLTRLNSIGIDLIKNTRVFFSGNKGFHVEVYFDYEFTPEELKTICLNLTKDIVGIDEVVYNKTRAIRLRGTKHQLSKLYKIELDPNDIWDLNAEEIKEQATKVSLLENATIEKFIDHKILDPYRQEVKEVIVPSIKLEEDTNGIAGLDTIDFTSCPPAKPRCIHALERGVMKPGVGQRSALMLKLATYYHNQGYTKDVTLNILKTIAKDNKKLYPNSELFSESEIQNTVLKSAYSGSFKLMPGASGIDPNNELVKYYCDCVGKYTNRPCPVHSKAVSNYNSIMKISDVYEGFDHYASNHDKNLVRTGINFIDNNMKFSVGSTYVCPAASGCHRKGEKVLLFSGQEIAVEDVKIGDKLMGPDSTPRTVLELKRGTEPIYKVSFDKNKTIRNKDKFYNESHILYFKERLGTGNSKMRAMSIKDYLEYKKLYAYRDNYILRQSIEFQETNIPIDPYVLGMWLGDGTSAGAAFTNVDPILISRFREYADSVGLDFRLKVCRCMKKFQTYIFSGKNGYFVSKLRGLDLYKNKHIPSIYLNNSREIRLQVLAGLLDTDGYLGTNTFEIIQKNKKLAYDIRRLCFSLGLQATLQECYKYCQTGGGGLYYRINISGNTHEIPTLLPKKRATPRKQIKNVNHLSFNIEKVSDSEEYYGFMVDKDNLYVDDDFLVTHNSGKTTIVLNMLEQSSLLDQPAIFFCCDMNRNQVYLKLGTKLTNYKQHEIYTFHKEKNLAKMQEIKDAISARYKKVSFDFSNTLTFDQIRDKIFEVEQKTGEKQKLVAIDYASRLAGPFSDQFANARYNALKSIEVANVTDTCSFILAQISRGAGDGLTPIRTKRVAKESSDWEESATGVITLWRPFMGDPNRDKVMRVYLAKNRMGPELEQVLYWDGSKAEVRDMTQDELVEYNETLGDAAEREYLKTRYGK